MKLRFQLDHTITFMLHPLAFCTYTLGSIHKASTKSHLLLAFPNHCLVALISPIYPQFVVVTNSSTPIPPHIIWMPQYVISTSLIPAYQNVPHPSYPHVTSSVPTVQNVWHLFEIIPQPHDSTGRPDLVHRIGKSIHKWLHWYLILVSNPRVKYSNKPSPRGWYLDDKSLYHNVPWAGCGGNDLVYRIWICTLHSSKIPNRVLWKLQRR